MAQKCPVCSAESQRMYGADWCPQCGTIIANELDWQAPKSVKSNKRLLAAAKKVLSGLNARIDAAPSTAKPVFKGIADLHAAIASASPQG